MNLAIYNYLMIRYTEVNTRLSFYLVEIMIQIYYYEVDFNLKFQVFLALIQTHLMHFRLSFQVSAIAPHTLFTYLLTPILRQLRLTGKTSSK